MLRTSSIAVVSMAMILLASPTIAQDPVRKGPSRGGGQLPGAGTQLPTLTAVDEQGKDFSTASLRGSYTVLVFGCLT